MNKVVRTSLVGESVRIELKKEAGSEEWAASFDAGSFDGALYGLQALIEEFSSVTGLPVDRVIALVAARMLSNPE